LFAPLQNILQGSAHNEIVVIWRPDNCAKTKIAKNYTNFLSELIIG